MHDSQNKSFLCICLALCLFISLFFLSNKSFSQDTADAPTITLGGAVRVNYAWRDYDDDSDGQLEFELFRGDVDISQGNWYLDAQYRWYPGFEAVHHAEVGYKLSETDTIGVGVIQVPFGIDSVASHSFWFGGTYYLGLEDDYDSGIRWRSANDESRWDLAYFTNSEYNDASRFGRYSFDIASTDDKANREDGQLNVRWQTALDNHWLGFSAQTGKFQNEDTQATGQHWAIAAHGDLKFNDWNIQIQALRYHHEEDDDLGTGDGRIALSGFDFPFEIAAEADVFTFNVSKTFEINNDFADSITCYNDATSMSPTEDRANLSESIQNVTGCVIAKGGLYTYIDWIAGKNMWFAGGPGVGIREGDSDWQSRLNINIGWYF